MVMKSTLCSVLLIALLASSGLTMAVNQTGDQDLGAAMEAAKKLDGENKKEKQQEPDGGNNVSLASCEVLSTQLWDKRKSKAKWGSGQKKEVFMVFDETGSLCYQYPQAARITKGDLITIGVYGDEETVGKYYPPDVPDCALEPTTLQILDTVGDTRFHTQSAGKKSVRKFQPFECYNDKIELKVRNSDRSIVFERSINQYLRYQGTLQVGMLWTDLDEINYSLVDKGNGDEITADRDDSSGPVYVGSLVVYGIAHHIEGIWSGSHYSGRDIINENNALDRLGLALSFGFDSPKDTFGIGLTYEIATGLNITATQLYRRLDVLDADLAVGDSFSGAIPTQKSWEDDVVWGLSIDGRYLAKFFGSGK